MLLRPRKLNHLNSTLFTINSGNWSMQIRAHLHRVQITPNTFSLMVINAARPIAIRTSQLFRSSVGQVDVDFLLFYTVINSHHFPRRFDTQQISIKFLRVHAHSITPRNFSENCLTNCLIPHYKSRRPIVFFRLEALILMVKS